MYCAKFYPKKKKLNKKNWKFKTNVNLLCKPKEILSRQKKKKIEKEKKERERQKVGYWMEKGNFVQYTSSSFSLHFGEIEFW